MPSMEEIVGCYVPLFRHVPRTARREWGKVLRSVMRETGRARGRAEEEVAAKRYMMVARCVLWDKGRGGKKQRSGRAKTVVGRCVRWMRGDVKALWEEVQGEAVRRAEGGRGKGASKFARANRLVSEGRYSMACKALLSEGAISPTEEVKEALRGMHPTREKVKVPEGLEAYALETAGCRAALGAMPVGSAGGVSLMRADHMRAADVDGEDTMEVVAGVWRRIAEGKWLCSQVEWLAAGR